MFRNFLQLSDMIARSEAFTPRKIAEISDLMQGGRDFVYLPEKGLLFVAMSEMKITNRIDSYLTNVST